MVGETSISGLDFQPPGMLDVLRGRRKLVGQPLLYGISVFASLGVFLVFQFSSPPLNGDVSHLVSA